MAHLLKSTERLVEGMWRKTTVLWRSAELAGRPALLPWNEEAVREIASQWKQEQEAGAPGSPFVFTHAKPREMCERIRKETEVWNRNNVTRTQAYWNIYEEFPELHWALLAHMVSRNGGWHMTDLKGEWLPRLLSGDEAREHFHMLETCNALIFRDAYPQLKLYAESRRSGQPLFHLLPYFRVSAFMPPFWRRFWDKGDSALLSVALIINEQHVIQGPVVDDAGFRERVFDTAAFRSQRYLQTNQIVLPIHADVEPPRHHRIRLAGRILERFVDLNERIEFGKTLYALLFGYPKVLAGVTAFAREVRHTGSRADYWPRQFHRKLSAAQKSGQPRGTEPSASECWYSPPLEDAWPDQPLPTAPQQDWLPGRLKSALSYLTAPRPPRIVDMTSEHLLGLRKLAAAAELIGASEAQAEDAAEGEPES